MFAKLQTVFVPLVCVLLIGAATASAGYFAYHWAYNYSVSYNSNVLKQYGEHPYRVTILKRGLVTTHRGWDRVDTVRMVQEQTGTRYVEKHVMPADIEFGDHPIFWRDPKTKEIWQGIGLTNPDKYGWIAGVIVGVVAFAISFVILFFLGELLWGGEKEAVLLWDPDTGITEEWARVA